MNDPETPRLSLAEIDADGYLADRLLSRRALADYLDVDKATITRWEIASNEFPKPIYLTSSTKRWRLNEINDWINQKAKQ